MFDLNAFKTQQGDAPQSKSDLTRARILETALRLFREKGFDATTMRDIATACDLAVGTAYHHFESKEAIVGAYYDFVQREHLRRVTEFNSTGFNNKGFNTKKHTLKQRLEQAFTSKLEIVGGDQKLLSVIMRFIGESDHPLSIFGTGTQRLRDEGTETFTVALGDEALPADLRDLAPTLLWTLHMGMLLYFLHDKTGGERTKKLSNSALELVLQLFNLVRLPIMQPMLKPVFGKVRQLLKTYDLTP
jgi:AcrR family transcriptional regulator